MHGIIHTQAGINRTARRVDVHVDVAGPVAGIKEQQLRGDDVGHFVVDGITEKDDAVHQQHAVHIHNGHVHGTLINDILVKCGNKMFAVTVYGIARKSSVLNGVFFKF